MKVEQKRMREMKLEQRGQREIKLNKMDKGK